MIEQSVDELPEKDGTNLGLAINAVVNGDDWLITRQVGRYKAVGGYRNVEDRGLPEDEACEKCVIVKTLDNDIVTVVPFDSADEMIEVLL